MRISGGVEENGIVVGNAYDKYGSRNPIVRWLMRGFHRKLTEFVGKASPDSIHEIGCGEGYWTLHWHAQGLPSRGCDVSRQVIAIARENASRQGVPPSLFETRSIYELEAARDGADLIVCCEVLEHLEDPDAGLAALRGIVGRRLIVSVPREPLWRLLNLARLKYVAQFGNTPGHLQHFSKRAFIDVVSRHFEVLEVGSPLPWTMLLCRPRGGA